MRATADLFLSLFLLPLTAVNIVLPFDRTADT